VDEHQAPDQSDFQNTPLAEMRNITKNFGGLRALDSVDFAVGRAEVVGLVGGNGAGKSTLIKILTGIHPFDRGEIFFEGRRVNIGSRQDSRALGIESLYQDLSLVGSLDAVANVFLGKEMTKRYLGLLPLLDLRTMEREAVRILREQLGMDFSARWEPVYHMSGGERQAIALARAIYSEAKLVILDEPMAALGVEETKRTLAVIRRLRSNGISVVVISHNLEQVFSVVDRIAILNRGRKVADLPVRETSPSEAVRLMVHGLSATNGAELAGQVGVGSLG